MGKFEFCCTKCQNIWKFVVGLLPISQWTICLYKSKKLQFSGGIFRGIDNIIRLTVRKTISFCSALANDDSIDAKFLPAALAGSNFNRTNN